MYGISGFLGLPSDWDCFDTIHGVASTSEIPQKKIAIGYSQGGRQLLQSVLQNPHYYTAAVLISAHPGLENDEERKKRLAHDQNWAERFKKDPWDVLMDQWNRQPVFGGFPPPFLREERNYDRNQLADMLVRGSLGRQPNLRPMIASLQIPVLWISGARDAKFCAIAETVVLSHPLSKKIQVPEAGHRVPWENREFFHNTLLQFIGALYDSHMCHANDYLDHN